MKNKKILIIGLIVLALGGAILGIYFGLKSKSANSLTNNQSGERRERVPTNPLKYVQVVTLPDGSQEETIVGEEDFRLFVDFVLLNKEELLEEQPECYDYDCELTQPGIQVASLDECYQYAEQAMAVAGSVYPQLTCQAKCEDSRGECTGYADIDEHSIIPQVE